MKKVIGILFCGVLSFMHMVSVQASPNNEPIAGAQVAPHPVIGHSLDTVKLNVAPVVKAVDFCMGHLFVEFNIGIESESLKNVIQVWTETDEGLELVDNLEIVAVTHGQKRIEVSGNFFTTHAFPGLNEMQNPIVLITADVKGLNGINMKSDYSKYFEASFTKFSCSSDDVARSK